MVSGKVYLKIDNKLSFQTEDNRFFRITFKKWHKLYEVFEKIKVNDIVEWNDKDDIKIIESKGV